MKVLEELVPQRHQHFTDLIRKMLVIEPAKRITASRALEHPFFLEDD